MVRMVRVFLAALAAVFRDIDADFPH